MKIFEKMMEAQEEKRKAEKRMVAAAYNLAATWEENPGLPRIYLGGVQLKSGKAYSLRLAPGRGLTGEPSLCGDEQELAPEDFWPKDLVAIVDSVVAAMRNLTTTTESETESYLEAAKKYNQLAGAAEAISPDEK